MSGNEDFTESSEDCILYELLVYAEWRQDPELLFQKYSKTGDLVNLGANNHSSRVKRALSYFGQRDTFHNDIFRILQRQLPWHFAVGEGGKVVAILQEMYLEIRTSRDEYSSVVGKASIPKDPNLQWRKLAWSPDCSMLAMAHSNGVVSFYDLLGSNIFNIYPPKFQQDAPVEGRNAIASIIFQQSRRKGPKWSSELVLVDYEGNLRAYLVSPTEGYQESHTFSFCNYYRQGIVMAAYHPAHNMIFLAGPPSLPVQDSLKNHGSSAGLSAWRLLNDYPYYRHSLSADEEQAIALAQRQWWNWMPQVLSKSKQIMIFKMQVSPKGSLLACLHSCGSISLWHLPTMRLFKKWALHEQPGYDTRNPLHSEFSEKYQSADFYPVDINWWSEKAVIIARYSGSVSVCSIGHLNNLLGESPEFLAGSPQVSALCSDHGFLGLECEVLLASKKSFWGEHTSLLDKDINEDVDDEEDDEDEDMSFLNRSSALIRSAVYMVTDMERFQPKRKRPKLCYKTYRLLGLKSTTPEELYARKIDNEEYGEALALAKAYNLDCDLVYQRQWRNDKVSIATIHDYLSKVSKRWWVLKECLERVPESYSAAHELLRFGLEWTSLETFFSLDEGEEGGDSVYEPLESSDIQNTHSMDKDEQTNALNKIRLCKVHVEKLTEEQKDLVQYRQQLLHYLDRLTTYEQILGGPSLAESSYDYIFYQKFRNASILDSTAEFAQEGNWQAVEIMFTYHGDITLSHWLPVLSNFPETMNPQEYKSLLPSSNSDGEVFLWTQDVLREEDWCEEDKFFRVAGATIEENADLIYESDPELRSFIWDSDSITCELLTRWYTMRVHQIESRSCMVDHALTLLKLARTNNIKGLESLFSELQTLYTLVYEVQLEHIGLSELHKMSPLEKAKLLMSKSQEATFVENLKNLLLPFLSQCESQYMGSRRHLLRDYLVDISSTDLSMPVRAFEYVCNEQQNSLVPTLDEKISLALDCLYAYPNADQLDKAFKILECVTSRAHSVESNIGADLHQKLTELRQELHAAKILDRNSLPKPLSYIHDCKSNSSFAEQLLIKLARNTAKRIPPPTTLQWNELLNDMLDLQSECFSCVSIGVCFEIYVATLLSSGSKENIRAASDILECRRVTWSSKNIPYNRSVTLVLQAAMEYLDSAGSLTDPSMDLAKACLHLITDENPEIEEKLDLIAALQMLSDFGLVMLPLQVRLCKDRLRLVESCIRSKPTAYRNSQRLLQLAYKLRVCGNDSRQREGNVLTLVAETALQMEDYIYCAEICQQLAAKHHVRGWQVVKDLAQCEDFSNLEVKYELLAFALLHCPPEAVEDLIITRCLLEARILHQLINVQVQQREAEINSADEDEFSDALTSPLTPNKEFLPVSTIVHAVGDSTEIIRKTTYNLLKNVGNRNFWKARISWMTANTDEKSGQDEEQHFLVQGFPTFYASLLSMCHLSCLDASYGKFVTPDIKVPELKVCQLLLRTTLLEDTAMQECHHDSTEVLLQLSINTLADDGCLGLAYLLTLRDIASSDKCFTSISSTAISLQLAMYYYALQGAKNIISSEDLFLQDPNALTESMIKVDCGEKWTRYLTKYQNMLQDFLQGEQLQKLGCGVDLQRFTHDIQYQQDTILGLAMTVDKDRFALALTLGSRHGIPMEDIAATHVAALLLNRDELSFGELAARLADEQLIRLLRTNPTVVCDRLTKHAYPDIDGKDHQLLVLYFSLLQSIIDDVSIHSLTPKEHIKQLKKVRATSSVLDYKKLINPSNNVLDVLKPALEKNNVGAIAKLLKSMPSSVIGSFHEGQVYVLWAQKEFFQIAGNTNVTDEKYLKQFEACSSHISRMLPNDVLDMVKGICFGEQSFKLMSVNCRKQMILLAKDLCEQRSQVDKRENWNEAVRTLQHWYMHLHELSSSVAVEFSKECSPEGKLLFRMLDLTRGEAGPVNQFLKAAVLSEQSLDSLQKLLMLVPKPTPTMNNLLQNLFKDAVTKLRNGDKEEGSKLLLAVLRRMQESVANNNVEVPEEVEALCGDGNLSPEVRLQALNLLQSLRPNADGGDSLLLYHHTQAMVASAWPHSNFHIQGADVLTSQSRASLFCKLMHQTESWPQFIMLTNLLTKWPQFDALHIRELGTNPWMQLLQRMLLSEEKNLEQLKEIIENVFVENTFPEDHIQYLVSSTEGSTELELLLLICLLSGYSTLYSTAISLIQKYLQVKQSISSKQILSLLLQKGLASALVSTPVYHQLIEFLMTKDNGEIPSSSAVANQLQTAGSIPEAGMLYLLSKNVSPALMLFSASLEMVKSSSCK